MTHPSEEITQARRTLLADLETSLADSQQALLSRDFARLERCTREQIAWQRSLAALGPPGICDLESGAALHAARTRVLHAGRVQAALLGRAQRWLRTLSNLIAGPESNYLPPSGHGTAPYLSSPAGRNMAPHLLPYIASLADCPAIGGTVNRSETERD